MHHVAELYGKHSGDDIYVVGTGASLRVFPIDFFAGRIVIGLNMAWKLVPVTYGITIHPDLNIPEFMPGERPHPEITWITGHSKAKALLTDSQLSYAEANFYFFDYRNRPNTQPPDQPSDAGRNLDWVRAPSANWLYVWSSISQTGLNLAANLGARNVILVGCDNMALSGNHHAHAQHTRWKGVSPDERYRQYYEGLAEVRQALRIRGVNVLSLTPFVSLASPSEDFDRLCRECNVAQFIENRDVSPRRPVGRLTGLLRQLVGR
jgi:hypothetical protein